MRLITTLILCLLIVTPVLADSITTDFENGENLGNWTFNSWSEGIQAAGGNPDGWFLGTDMWTFAPILHCERGAAGFTGDFTALGVTQISGDFITPYCQNDPGANGFNFTVVLRNDLGTPDNVDDDVYVYPDPFANLIPQIGEGWTHYDFAIPSDFVGAAGELPAGWVGGSAYTGGDIFPSDFTFQGVISGVTTVEFWWLHPAYFAIIVPWEAGGDNITIEFGGGSVATEHATFDEVKALYR